MTEIERASEFPIYKYELNEMKWRLHFLLIIIIFFFWWPPDQSTRCNENISIFFFAFNWLMARLLLSDFMNFMCTCCGFMKWVERKPRKKVAPPLTTLAHHFSSLKFAFFLFLSPSSSFSLLVLLFVSVAHNSIITIKYGLNLWLKLKYHPLRQKNRKTKKMKSEEREEKNCYNNWKSIRIIKSV